jgi:hypothetical protein
VAACWLQTQYADMSYAQMDPRVTVGMHNAILKRQDSAQRRYLHAIKTLATVRKLLKPSPSAYELARRDVPETSRPNESGNRRQDRAARR